MSRRIIILGNGGHAISVADVVLESLSSADRVLGFIAPDAVGKPVLGSLKVIGNDDDLARLASEGTASHFVVGVGSINGGSSFRAQLFERALAAGLTPLTAIHPRAVVSRWAEVGDGTVVMAGAVINARSTLGRSCIVNTGSIIDHDARLGDHVHIAPGATLSGSVVVANHSLVGIGATVKQGIVIGSGATVAAGAVVVTNVADDETVMGVPARAPR